MSDSSSNAGYDGSAETPFWRERRNVMVGGGIAVVVLGLGAYFLLFAGSSSEDTGGGVVASAARNAGAAATASPTAAVTKPAVYDEDTKNNPFEPLYPAAPTIAATTEVLPATDTGASGAVPVPSAVPTPVTTSEPVPVETTVTTKTVKVQLVAIIDEDTVSVRLNGGQAFAAKKGVVFGGAFSLANTRPDEGEATFNYGDGEPFSLAVGETEKIVVTS